MNEARTSIYTSVNWENALKGIWWHLAFSAYKMPVRSIQKHTLCCGSGNDQDRSFQASFRNTVRTSNTFTLPLFCKVMVNLPFSNTFGLVESCQSTLSCQGVLISLLFFFFCLFYWENFCPRAGSMYWWKRWKFEDA